MARGIAGVYRTDCANAECRRRIAWDGQLHNRADLQAALAPDDPRARAATDADLVLRAYERWGAGCAAHLLGEFAFAIWDDPRQQLFCVRDRLGVKPFHYRFDGRTFAFASEIRRLIDQPGYTAVPNETMLGLLLVDSCQEVEETLYKGVFRLPPAHCLTVTRAGVKQARYWQLDPPPVLRYASDDAYAEQFREIFQQAVECRIEGARRIGVLVSGGVDSSAVACLARNLPRERDTPAVRVDTFSAVFDDPACDERHYLREVTKADPAAAHCFYPEADDRTGLDFDADDPYPMGPLYYPNLSMLRRPLQAARDRGIAIVLTGMGGDELFTSYHYCADLLKAGRWGSLRREVRSIGTGLTRLGACRTLFRYALRPFIPAAVKRMWPARVPAWIRPEFARRSGLSDRIRARRRRTILFPEVGRQVLYDALFTTGAYPFAFEEEDRFSRLASVEFRAPLLDLRLIRFALALPLEQRTWRGRTKVVLRNGLKDVLPDAIRLRRDKADFLPFMDRELRVRQRASVDALFRRSRLAEAGIVDGYKIRAQWREYCERGGTRAWTILTLLNLERSWRALER